MNLLFQIHILRIADSIMYPAFEEDQKQVPGLS